MIALDTHVLIWAVQDDGRLGDMAAQRIEDAARQSSIVIPAICAWEVALIEKRGKIRLAGGALAWMRSILATPAFSIAELELPIAVETVTMAWAHKDPADRMIVATARYRQVPLLTADEEILAYAAAGHLNAIDARR